MLHTSIYTDLAKAFDEVIHELLFNKLDHLGFSDSLPIIFQSYLSLSRRKLYASYNGFKTHTLLATSSATQTPNFRLLFILFTDLLL